MLSQNLHGVSDKGALKEAVIRTLELDKSDEPGARGRLAITEVKRVGAEHLRIRGTIQEDHILIDGPVLVALVHNIKVERLLVCDLQCCVIQLRLPILIVGILWVPFR